MPAAAIPFSVEEGIFLRRAIAGDLHASVNYNDGIIGAEAGMALTGKQKRILRGKGQTLDPVVFIGKEGISEAGVASTEDAFRWRELIKVRVLTNAPDDTAVLGKELASATQSELVGKVGHTFLLYRPNPNVKEPIVLPQA